MATGKTGTIIIGANYSLRMRVTWVEEYDTGTNTSTISITKLEALTDSSYTGKWFPGGKLIVNGETVGTMSYMGMATHQVNVQYALTWFEVKVQSGSGGQAFPWVSSAIAHNSDGTKSISISWEDIALYRSSDANNYFISDGSEGVTLTTIPRESTFSLSGNGSTAAGNVYVNINDSNKLTVNISRAANTFTHDVEFYMGSTQIAKHTGIATQTSLTLSAATWLPRITDRKETNGLATANAPSVKVTTKDASGNSIGSSSKRFDIYIPDTYAPSVRITGLTPVSSLGAPFNSLYLQGLSKVKVTVSASAQHGATYSYKMSVDGGIYGSAENYTSNYLNGYGAKTVTVTATDSRGYSSTDTQDITVIPYSAPKILPVSGEKTIVCARCTADGTLNDSGTYLRIKAMRDFHKVESGGVQNNFCAIQYRYKSASGSYSAWATILDRTAATDVVDTGAILAGGLSADTTYSVQVQAVDDIGNTGVATFNIPSEAVYLHKRATSLGVGTYNYNDNSVAVGWNVDMTGKTISNLGTPTASNDAVPKSYADNRRAVNLLVNSDFRNPVNQRGKTGYTGDTYTIDRWSVWAAAGDGTLTVNSGYISFNGGANGGTFTQRFQRGILDSNKTYTMAYQKLSGEIAVFPAAIDYNFYNSCDLLTLCNTQNRTEDMVWAALYEGEYTAETLPKYQPKGYGAELAECQRYYMKFNNLRFNLMYCTDGTYRGAFLLPCSMRIAPTISYGTKGDSDGIVLELVTPNGFSVYAANVTTAYLQLENVICSADM